MTYGELRYGKVVKSHPEAHAVDLLMLDGAAERLPLVQCMGDVAGTDCGGVGLAAPTVTDAQNPYTPQQTKVRDIYAIVGYVRKTPIVLGFLYPQVSQMLFKDIDRSIKRTQSDVYWTSDALGNTELYHPSGTYIRIGTAPAHEDLTGKDLDGLWKIAKNTGTAPYVHVSVGNAGTIVSTLELDPSGNITGTGNGNLSVTVQGTALVQATGTAKLKSTVSVTLDAPAAFVTGTLDVTGAVTIHAGMTSTGDVVADGKSVEHHLHSGVTTGAGNTGPPV